ncbi:hypothetical protein RGQ29_018409 [Quercus rubra]|uniref:Uncharacterized protein n=1 Tax=Quercus rubra TaxID=3512 RepID=A0AAN7IUI6_QUERU|nr:hypothetical protein RGQ29_018409 [Quercus rubra]
MDQATAGELLHFHLTTFEEDESSTSAMRSDIIEVRVRAFKSTPRSAWKMGLDLRYVDRGIKIFQFYFRSNLQMEWLPSFCFICGVLGSGGFLRSGSHVLSDWRKGVFEKLCVAWRGGSEDERREEDTDFQIPVAVSPVSLSTEKGSCSTVPAVVCSLSPAPSSVEHSRVSQWSSEAKNRFWAFKCFLLWPKDLLARKPQVISFLLMSPPLEPKKRDSKMLTCKLRNIVGLSGSLRGVVCNCL